MKRFLLLTGLSLVLLFVVFVAAVSMRARDAEPLPPPDPAMAIALPDGETLPLAEVLERARRGELPAVAEHPVEPLVSAEPVMPADQAPQPDAAGLTPDLEFGKGPFPLLNGQPLVPKDPIYALAEVARYEGRNEQAIALYLSIPRDSEHYARARRLVAWNILARNMDKPQQAVRYANEALHAAPFDANAWHDWSRVYARSLGFPVD